VCLSSAGAAGVAAAAGAVQVQVQAADNPLGLLVLLQLCAEGPCCLMALCNAEGAVRLVA
jgi:hypothetical protein